jgi:hypothetical protein
VSGAHAGSAPGSVEPDLVRLLGRWALGSVVAGGVLALDQRTRGFGRQTAAWGAVDGVIALVGARRQAAGRTTPDARLRRVLLVNAGLDVGYLAAGAWLLRRTRWRGDGAAVLVQGAFLLWLDATYARRLGAPARPAGGADRGRPAAPPRP